MEPRDRNRNRPIVDLLLDFGWLGLLVAVPLVLVTGLFVVLDHLGRMVGGGRRGDVIDVASVEAPSEE